MRPGCVRLRSRSDRTTDPECRIPHNSVCRLRYRSTPRPLVQRHLSPEPRHWSSRHGNFLRAGIRSPARCRSAFAHYEGPVCRYIFACINGRFSGNAEVSNVSHLCYRGTPVEACERVPDLAINDAVAAHRAIETRITHGKLALIL